VATAGNLRGDIQGLRAVAVLAVVGAHAGVPFLPGGFVGVDVFFVVSGYLIAGLTYREVQRTGRVPVAAFWARRARRILPAATLVTVVTVGVSLAWTSLLDTRDVVVDALWAAAFAANIHVARQDGAYFASDGAPSPLQHYWSLAVEEQFYLVWPLLLLACLALTRLVRRSPGAGVRLPHRTVAVTLAVLVATSLAWSLHRTSTAPETAYLSTSTRVWELAAGALLALAPAAALSGLTRRALEALAVAGAALVLAACVLLTPATPFPGVAALLPVLGTVLLLAAGSVTRVPGKVPRTSRVLAAAPLRTVGDWSYSLYLWHWPALMVPTLALGRPLTGSEKPLAVLVALTLTAYSYSFVETPFRTGSPAHRMPSPRALVLYPASASLVVTAAAAAWWWTGYEGGERGEVPAITVVGATVEGRPTATEALVRASVDAARRHQAVPSDLVPDLLEVRGSVADVGGCDYEDDVGALCPRGDGARTVVVLGDSHARAWIPAFERILEPGGWRAYYLVRPQCPAALVTVAAPGSDASFTECSDFRDWALRQVAALRPDLVVVTSSPPVNGVVEDGERITSTARLAPLLRRGYDRLFAELARHAGEVALVRDVPKAPDDPAGCLSTGRPSLDDCLFAPVERAALLADAAVAAAEGRGIPVVDPTPWLCHEGACPAVVGRTITYRDTDHLTTEYAAGLWRDLGAALHMLGSDVTSPSLPS